MQDHPDHHDAELLLRLYELRREATLRQAREWFVKGFRTDSAETLTKRYPFGTQENAFFRMVVSYWEMAASLLNHGLIHEDLFFENNPELWAVWAKIEPMVAEIREANKDSSAYRSLEIAAKKYEAWMEKRSPGALSFRRARLDAIAANDKVDGN
jgi:hypothetical protein